MNMQRIISLTASAALFFIHADVTMAAEMTMPNSETESTQATQNNGEEGAVLGMVPPYANAGFNPQMMSGKFGGPLGPYQSPMGQMPFPTIPGMPPMPFPPQPGMPIQPFGGGLIPVSVQGDATYLVPGPVCSGSGIAPAGFQCPRAGMQAVADCHPNIPSNRGFGACIAPVNAICVQVNFNTWGCAFENGMGRVPAGQPWMQGQLPMMQGSVPPLGLPMQQSMPPMGLPGLPRPQMPMGLPMAQTQMPRFP